MSVLFLYSIVSLYHLVCVAILLNICVLCYFLQTKYSSFNLSLVSLE